MRKECLTIELKNEKNEAVDSINVLVEYNQIKKKEIENYKNSEVYVKCKNKDIYVKYHVDFSIYDYFKNSDYDFDYEQKYYFYNGKFIPVKVVFYGGRGGEYAILNENEKYEILTSKGYYQIYDNDFVVIYNYGSFSIFKGKIIFVDDATIHGSHKIRYNQKIIVYTIDEDSENVCKERFIVSDKYIIDKYKKSVIFSKYNDFNIDLSHVDEFVKFSDLFPMNYFTEENSSYIRYILFNYNGKKVWFTYKNQTIDINEIFNFLIRNKYNLFIIKSKKSENYLLRIWR